MSQPGFWDNPETAQDTVVELKAQKAILTPYEDLASRIDDLEVLHELAVEDGSEIGSYPAHILSGGHSALRFERIGIAVGETAVRFSVENKTIQIQLFSEYLAFKGE